MMFVVTQCCYMPTAKILKKLLGSPTPMSFRYYE